MCVCVCVCVCACVRVFPLFLSLLCLFSLWHARQESVVKIGRADGWSRISSDPSGPGRDGLQAGR